MASNKQKQKRIRRRKETRMGQTRKRLIRRNGTTPKFPVHPDNPGKLVDVAAIKITEESE